MTVYGTMKKTCPECDGTGLRRDSNAEIGYNPEEKCSACGGKGEIDARSSKMAIKKAREARSNR
jgi:DnaJ-class molecular chaperone